MTHDNAKRERIRLLRKLIQEGEIHDQVQLQEGLLALGVGVTQATISRDLQELGVAKVRIRPGVFRYTFLEQLPQNYLMDQLRVLFDNFVYAVNSTGNLLLVKTSPGNANGVASLIDRIAFPGVLGTVAGDDTVLVVVDTAANRIRVQRSLDGLLAAQTP